MKIPKFKETGEALAFGRKHQGNKKVMEALRKEHKRLGDIADAIPMTAENYNKIQIAIMPASLVREALEAALGMHE